MVDEAASNLKIEMTSKPSELENLEREILQLEMEIVSLESDLKYSKDDKSKKYGLKI